MNKTTWTNLLTLFCLLIAFWWPWEGRDYLLNASLFALSGALTNWLAVHMLFEKIPLIYGSGVIPERFEEFKAGIRNMILKQFFNKEDVSQFLQSMQGKDEHGASALGKIADGVDFEVAFSQLTDVIMKSSFAPMLAMVGGEKALSPLKQPFIEKMSIFLKNTLNDPKIISAMHTQTGETMVEKVEGIVDQRLKELTSESVKIIVQEMIREHLGWLVVWGGVAGALMGIIVQGMDVK
jgi:uncharacterized membrane protein YheB (UPF0754 family)